MIRRWTWVYWLIAGLCSVLGIVIGYTSFATQLDNDFYDFLFRIASDKPVSGQSVLLAVDEATLSEHGGMRRLRATLAEALEQVAAAKPAVLAIDLTMPDAQDDAEDAALAAVLAKFPKLVLASEMMPDGSRWQDPLEAFSAHASALGHVNALPDPYDAVNRAIPLERVAGRERRWALALEAWRLGAGVSQIEGSPEDVRAGDLRIDSRWDAGRPMRVRFHPRNDIPRVPVARILSDPSAARALAGKVVFLGVTAQSAARDRLLTPLSYSLPMVGVEIHAQAFETIATRQFLDDVSPLWPVLLALAAGMGAALIFTFAQGWLAYALAALLLAVLHIVPAALFSAGLVMPAVAPLAAGWLSILGVASWQHFFVRRQLARSEGERARYQQAIQFVTHEMRTPLTAIQGSSELITRYNLPEDKRKQLGSMINSESKRLAQMITTFLNVEKLTAGQLELKRSEITADDLLASCVERARPLADRKQIVIDSAGDAQARFVGDRELVEYAVYNLLTNAIKYSPPMTRVEVTARAAGKDVEVSVRDQGMGMNEKELKNLFRRFYRTESAEKSGEVGTGIGLSIVDQIVAHHGGKVRVTSAPGKGSCFVVSLPAAGEAIH
jgi:signal transduction histidine kinase